MKPEIENRVTVKVADMRKQPEETLLHLCAQQQVWALMKGSQLGANRLTKQPVSNHTLQGSLHSTGSWGLQRKEKCLPPGEGEATCLMCETAPLGQASTQDVKLLKAVKEKQLKKIFLKKKPEKETKLQGKVGAQEEVSILSSAALSTFKMSTKKKRMYVLSAWSGLADKRPPPQDNNIWNKLIASCRGYTYSAKILAQILGLLRKNGSVNHTGPDNLSPYQKALWAIFAGERSNSYQAIQNRRGTPPFKIKEVNNILFLCGRKMAEDTTSGQPSIDKQDTHCFVLYHLLSRLALICLDSWFILPLCFTVQV